MSERVCKTCGEPESLRRELNEAVMALIGLVEHQHGVPQELYRELAAARDVIEKHVGTRLTSADLRKMYLDQYCEASLPANGESKR